MVDGVALESTSPPSPPPGFLTAADRDRAETCTARRRVDLAQISPKSRQLKTPEPPRERAFAPIRIINAATHHTTDPAAGRPPAKPSRHARGCSCSRARSSRRQAGRQTVVSAAPGGPGSRGGAASVARLAGWSAGLVVIGAVRLVLVLARRARRGRGLRAGDVETRRRALARGQRPRRRCSHGRTGRSAFDHNAQSSRARAPGRAPRARVGRTTSTAPATAPE